MDGTTLKPIASGVPKSILLTPLPIAVSPSRSVVVPSLSVAEGRPSGNVAIASQVLLS